MSSSLPLTIEITPTTVNPMPKLPMPDATEAVIPKMVTIAPRTAIILFVVFILNCSMEERR